MNGKLIILTIAICVLLVSGIDGYRRRSEEYERKLFDGLGGAAKAEFADFTAEIEADLKRFFDWLGNL